MMPMYSHCIETLWSTYIGVHNLIAIICPFVNNALIFDFRCLSSGLVDQFFCCGRELFLQLHFTASIVIFWSGCDFVVPGKMRCLLGILIGSPITFFMILGYHDCVGHRGIIMIACSTLSASNLAITGHIMLKGGKA